MSDLERAYSVLAAKQDRYTKLFQYASGDQPVTYSTARLREAFNAIDVKFTQNWCSVVIDSTLDRMNFRGWMSKNAVVRSTLDRVFSEQQIILDAYDVHRSALITHEAYIIAWKENDQVEVYYNDPRICHMFYKASNPKQKDFACKWFRDGGTGIWHMTLYYPDRLEYYETKPIKDPMQLPGNDKAFFPSQVDKLENTFGEIPVFHFRINQRTKSSDLDNIITLQDAVNKLLADMMVAAEFGAFKQRWIISNTDTTALKNKPNAIWQIPIDEDGRTQVGQFDTTELDNFLNAIDKLANSIAIISRTPKHYFYGSETSASGEALLAMEAPLTKKVEQRIDNFGATWQELGVFIARKLMGINTDVIDVVPQWEPAQSIQPYTEAQTIKMLTDAGLPLRSALRMAGKTQIEIEQVEKDQQEEAANQKTIAQLLLDQARQNAAQSNNPDQVTNAANNNT